VFQPAARWVDEGISRIDGTRVPCRRHGAREGISLIKFFGAKVLHSVVDKAIQVFGAAGVTEDHPLSMFYLQARFARIYDGPDEVHKMVVARRILAAYEKTTD